MNENARFLENAYLAEQAEDDRFTEEHLVQAARLGDLSAFNRLVVMHQDTLYRWVLSLVKDDDLAADLTQSTLITAYEKLNTFHGGSFRVWLFIIARNRSFDEFRRQKRRPSISLEAGRDQTSSGDDDDFNLLSIISGSSLLPEEEVERAEQAKLISRLVEAIPEGFRQVLQLVDVEGMDYPEAAEVLKIPLGTVKSRLARARLKFRDLARSNHLLH
ncbi:MAG: sigma-70 family RNA polymerase sigma factor [Chloroflexi bacterium]|nr:MAG: sigma-70 family RNA polymerase sigma factor [Chloroflexota bacterium]